MLWFYIALVWFAFTIIWNAIATIKHWPEYNRFDFGDIISSTIMAGFVGVIITLLGSLFVDNSSLVITNQHYDLVEVADGVYGYYEDDNYLYLYYNNENGDMEQIRVGWESNKNKIIYTDRSDPYCSLKEYDAADETLRYLFWNMLSYDLSICVPPGSIVEKPD